MTYNVYSVRDSKSTFGPLTLDNHTEHATRDFAYFCSSGLARFSPDDYVLYCVGTFDLDSGSIVPFPVPQYVISGTEALRIYQGG